MIWKHWDDRFIHGVGPGQTNGEVVREPGPGPMTKEEVRTMLKSLFNITDEISVEVVWEEMEEQRKKKKEDG